MNASAVVRAARCLLGVPFRHQGRTEQGLDCIGLVMLAHRNAGGQGYGDVPANYGRLPRSAMLEWIANNCEQVQVEELGGLIAFQWPGDVHPGHVAVCAGRTMIHCYSHMGKVIEHGFAGKWRAHAHSFWRLPGVIYG